MHWGAVKVDLHVPVPFLSRTVCTLAEAAPPQEVSVHLQDLLERSSEELTEEQRSQLAEMLTEFQDVLARIEFNFRDFTALVHEIHTGDAPPPCQGKDAEDPGFFRWGGGGLPKEDAGCGCHPALYIGLGFRCGAD